jgi:hypothetical protein
MKWFPFLEAHRKYSKQGEPMLGKDGAVWAHVGPLDTKIVIYGQKHRLYKPLVAVRSNGTLTMTLNNPDTETFLLVTIYPFDKDGYDILTDGTKIGYIYSPSHDSYLYLEGVKCTVLDKPPPQAVALTHWHAELIDEMGRLLDADDAIV